MSKNGTSRNGYASRLLLVHAQTSMHPGSGTALGVVDLPVQRERHTQWPIIPASTLKGVMRDACRELRKSAHDSSRRRANEEDEQLVAAFGPAKPDETSSHAGALSFTDARLLAFPVRSLVGVFAWVTCPAVLQRLQRDISLSGNRVEFDIPKVDKDRVACAKHSPLLIEKKSVVLEEFDFECSGDSTEVSAWISSQTQSNQLDADRLAEQLVILNNDDFTYFVRHATEVVARIGLDYERKTVKTGALFYQEFLPPETIFYSVVLASNSRRGSYERNSADFLALVEDILENRPVLQIGGDESTGKGFCFVSLMKELT